MGKPKMFESRPKMSVGEVHKGLFELKKRKPYHPKSRKIVKNSPNLHNKPYFSFF